MTRKNGEPCKQCGTSEWYDNGICKECHKVRNKKWHKNNPEYQKEYQKMWVKNNPDYAEAYRKGDKHRTYKRHKQREYRKRNKEKIRKYGRDYYTKHKHKLKANRRVNKEVKLGNLPKAPQLCCDKCGKNATEYHHPDYTFSLYVIPLCRSCHSTLHGKGNKELYKLRKGEIK